MDDSVKGSHKTVGGHARLRLSLSRIKSAVKMSSLLLPISVEVHHALMDGLHVGRFLTRLEAALPAPESFVMRGKG